MRARHREAAAAPSWSTRRRTGSRAGARPARHSTTGASSTSLAGRGAGRGPDVFDATHAAAARAARPRCRSTASASTTPTASPTRAATSSGWPTPPATPGSWSRRSSRATSGCPTTGGAPARPATTRCCGSAGASSTPPAPSRSTGCAAVLHPAGSRPRRRGRRGEAAGRRRRAGRRGRPAGAAARGRVAALDDVDLAASAAPGARRRCSSRMDRYRAYVVPGRAGRTPSRRRSSTRRPSGARALIAPSDHAGARASCVTWCWPARRPGAASQPSRAATSSACASSRPAGRSWPRASRTPPSTAGSASPALNEVGGDPDQLSASSADEFHDVVAERSADALADLDDHADDPRHQALRGRAGAADAARRGRRRAGRPGWTAARELAAAAPPGSSTGPTEYLVWQTLVGTWPITGARLEAYLLKAVREAKRAHRLDGDPDAGTRGGRAPSSPGPCPRPAVQRHLETWVAPHAPSRAGDHPGAEAAPADHARRARRLPGQRARRSVPGRPRQPPPGRLGRSGAAARPVLDADAPPATSPTRSCWSPRARCGCAGRTRSCSGGAHLRARVRTTCCARARLRPRATTTACDVVAVATRLPPGCSPSRRLRRRAPSPCPRALARRARPTPTQLRRRGGRSSPSCWPTARWPCWCAGEVRSVPSSRCGRPHAERPCRWSCSATPGRCRPRRPMPAAPAGWWETAGSRATPAYPASTTRSCSTAASPPCPTRAAPGSRTACTARAAPSTRPPSPGPTATGAGRARAQACSARCSTSCTSARSPRRAPSTRRVGRLDHLVDLGVDVVELMPVAAFPGRWGWGYDGVDL